MNMNLMDAVAVSDANASLRWSDCCVVLLYAMVAAELGRVPASACAQL